VNIRASEDPPEKRNGASLGAEPESQKFELPPYYVRGVLSSSSDSWGCRDCWIEKYITFVEALNVKFGLGPITDHTVRAAWQSYDQYRRTCDGFFRFSAWRAVSAACQLFAQRARRN
jgi:hypothetical protein